MTSPKPSLKRAEEIYEDLRKRILSGELAAGARLPAERELSESYGSNRNTLREAVRKLEQDHLVTVRHGQGVTVADFRKTGHVGMLGAFFEHGRDPNEKIRALLDLLPARVRLIEFAIELAASRADASDLSRLSDLATLVITAFETRDDHSVALGYQRWLDALVDAAHSLPLRWTANPFLQTERDMHARFPMLYVLEPSLPDCLRAVQKAIEDGDAAAAFDASRAYFGRVDAVVRTLAGSGFTDERPAHHVAKDGAGDAIKQLRERPRGRRHDA